MSVVMKVIAVVFVAAGAFLVYAVVNAAASSAGARVGVAIGYVAGAFVLGFLAVTLWRKSGLRRAAAVAGD
jgi:membrane protein YqaA with SNARE-associated domain